MRGVFVSNVEIAADGTPYPVQLVITLPSLEKDSFRVDYSVTSVEQDMSLRICLWVLLALMRIVGGLGFDNLKKWMEGLFCSHLVPQPVVICQNIEEVVAPMVLESPDCAGMLRVSIDTISQDSTSLFHLTCDSGNCEYLLIIKCRG